MLTAREVRKLLAYDPETGELTWLPRKGATRATNAWNARYACTAAGCVNSRGYVSVGVYGVTYQAHRLIWLMQTGRWPDKEVDHVNGVRDDNRWCNLRKATRAENQHNAKRRQDNMSGHKGIHWNKAARKWTVTVNSRYVGRYVDLDEAIAVRDTAAKQSHGRFYRGAR